MFSFKCFPLLAAVFADEIDRYGRPPSALANNWAKEQLHQVIDFDELQLVSV